VASGSRVSCETYEKEALPWRLRPLSPTTASTYRSAHAQPSGIPCRDDGKPWKKLDIIGLLLLSKELGRVPVWVKLVCSVLVMIVPSYETDTTGASRRCQ
jgi:hypothetical protein